VALAEMFTHTAATSTGRALPGEFMRKMS